MPGMLQEHLLDDEEVQVPVNVFEDEPISSEDNDNNSNRDLDKCHWGELIFALLAGFVFLGLQHVPGKSLVYFLVGLCVFSGCYVLYKIQTHGLKPVANEWGLTVEHFGPCFVWCTLEGGLAMVVMAVIGMWRETALPYDNHLAICLVLYPLWGCVQQFMIQDMIALNLSKLSLLAKAPVVIWFLTACSFSIVHYGNWELMSATFLMGILFTPIFLSANKRCIYPLGLYHGWLGALFYWWVLGRDPLRNL